MSRVALKKCNLLWKLYHLKYETLYRAALHNIKIDNEKKFEIKNIINKKKIVTLTKNFNIK